MSVQYLVENAFVMANGKRRRRCHVFVDASVQASCQAQKPAPAKGENVLMRGGNYTHNA